MKFSLPLESEGASCSSAPFETASGRELLIVSENEQAHIFIRHLLVRFGWTVCSRFTFQEASAMLAVRKFPVVLCDCDLPGDGWSSLLTVCRHGERPPRFILFSRFAEAPLWGEVLNAGGYDVLLYPFVETEVARVADLAWESWVREGPRTRPVSDLKASSKTTNTASVSP